MISIRCLFIILSFSVGLYAQKSIESRKIASESASLVIIKGEDDLINRLPLKKKSTIPGNTEINKAGNYKLKCCKALDGISESVVASELTQGMGFVASVILNNNRAIQYTAIKNNGRKLRQDLDVDAVVFHKNMRETSLSAFEALVDTDVDTLKFFYNYKQGEPCCANKIFLKEVLREKKDFDSHNFNKGGAFVKFLMDYKVVASPVEALVLGVNSGVIFYYGSTHSSLPDILNQEMVKDNDLDKQLAILGKKKFKHCLFGPVEELPEKLYFKLNRNAPGLFQEVYVSV